VLGLAPGLQTGETERMEGGAVVPVGKKRSSVSSETERKPQIQTQRRGASLGNPATRTREGGMPWWMHVGAMRARRVV